MLYLLVFSSSIAIATLWHSLGLLSALGVVWVLLLYVSRYSPQIILYAWAAYLLGVLSVVIYDLRISHPETLTRDTHYTIQAAETSRRYRLKSSEGQLWFLSSRAPNLSPGQIIRTSSRPQSRSFNPSWTRGFDPTTRQVWQEMDRQSLEREFDYDAWLYMRWIAGSLRDDQPELIWQASLGRLSRFKSSLQDHLDGSLTSSATRWLARGMLLGDRSWLDPDTYQHFIDSGLVHLIAVSGTHMGIMLALASLALLWMPFYIRTIVLGLVIVLYASLVGFHASVVRATLMSGLTLLVLLPWRKISIWRLLGYARVAILLRNPYMLVYDLWFSLSFWALLGILWVDKTLWSKIAARLPSSPLFKALEWILRIVLASLWASLGTLPVLGFFTWEINLWSAGLNTLAIPFVPLIMALLVLVSLVWSTWIGSGLERGLQQLLALAQYWAEQGIMLTLQSRAAWLLLVCFVSYMIRWILDITRPQSRDFEVIHNQ